MLIEVKKAEEVFDKLKLEEHSLYKVLVKVTPSNAAHEAVLFTGFKNGGYCVVYNNTYDGPIDMMKLYRMKVVKKLGKLKN